MPEKRGMYAVRVGLLNMSNQEEILGADCLAHVFWGVLDNNYRHFSNKLLTEAEQARYMDPESVRLLITRIGHMAEKLSCNKRLMNVSVPMQWLVRGAAEAAGYQSLRPISQYQGVWQPPVGYLPYVFKK